MNDDLSAFSSKVFFLNTVSILMRGASLLKAERRTIIVREIEHWRRSKLLPDHYCDFLLNLYADPTVAPKAKSTANPLFGRAARTISDATGRQWLMSFTLFTLISVVVLYFNVFHPLLQITFIIGFSFLLVWYGQRTIVRNEGFGLVVIATGHLTLFLGIIYMLQLYELNEWQYTVAAIGCCSLLWIIYGIKKQFNFMHLSGWLAFLFGYAIVLNQLSFAQTWYQIQLVWIPLSILFGWFCYFIHRYTKPVAGVLFITAIITWLLPEVYQILLVGFDNYFQLQLIVKIVAGGLILFLLRKQWMVWISE